MGGRCIEKGLHVARAIYTEGRGKGILVYLHVEVQ